MRIRLAQLIAGLLWLLAAAPGECQLFSCTKLDGAKPEKLLAYLEQDRASLPQNCVLFAIERLGLAKYTPAIPLLMKYLDYPRPPDPGPWHPHAQSVGYLYPAASALGWMGKASVPSLLSVIASSESSDLVRKNASEIIYALYSREDVTEGIAVMMRASRNESDAYSRAHLEDAARYWASRCPPEHQNACMAALQ